MRRRIAGRVGERFLHNAIDGRLQRAGQALWADVNEQVERNAVPRLPFAGQPLQGGRQAQVVQDARAETGRNVMHFFQRCGGYAAQFLHLDVQAGILTESFQIRQTHHERGKILGGAIVQFAGNAAAFFFLGGNHFFEQLAAQLFALAADFIGAGQIGRHGVECLGQVADFVIGPARHARREIALRYAASGLHQVTQRAGEDKGEKGDA